MLKRQAIRDLSPDKDGEIDRFLQHDLRNEHDELNIFRIYFNKMNGANPFDTANMSMVTMADTPKREKSTKRRAAISKYYEDLRESQSSSIRESIRESISVGKTPEHHKKKRKLTEDDYSDDFEEESIRESIVGGSSSQKILDNFRHSTERPDSTKAAKAKGKKHHLIKESIEEEIIEESIIHRDKDDSSASFVGVKKGKPANLASSDSIKEEISGSGRFNSSRMTPRIKDSIPEEIHGDDDYSDNFESISHSKSKHSGSLPKTKSQFSAQPNLAKAKSTPEPVIETREDMMLRLRLEQKFGLNVPDRAENLINDLINAKGIYESATTTQHVVDKFERMMALYETNAQIYHEKERHLFEEQRMRDEVNKIREDQIAQLIGVLLTNKSNLDTKEIGRIVSQQPISKDLQSKIDENVRAYEIKRKIEEEKTLKKKDRTPTKQLRFQEADESDSAELIPTGKAAESKSIAMFAKARIRRTKPLTEKEDEDDIDLGRKLIDKKDEKISESLESVPYSEDFEPDVSVAISKGKNTLVKSRTSIEEDIPEEGIRQPDSARDTITEKIGDDYSSNFDEISESIQHSKSMKNNLRPRSDKHRLNSKYSASKISEESIPEDIEQSVPMGVKGIDMDEDSSRKLNKIKGKQDRKSVSKPEIGGQKKPKNSSAHSKLLERLQESQSGMSDFIKTLKRGLEARYKDELDIIVKEYSESKITDREYQQKKDILDSWKDKELKEIHQKKLLIEGWVQMGEIVARTKNYDDSAGEISGSINDLRKAPKTLFTGPNYKKLKKEQQSEDSEFDVDDDSDDSIRLRRAKKQLRDIKNHEFDTDSSHENIEDLADQKMRKKATKKKKKAASQLIEEKEKAIREGLRQKMIELEEKHAQEMLDEALKIDVKKEIERRFALMMDFDDEQKMMKRRGEKDRQRRLEESIEDSSIGHRPSKYADTASIEASQKQDVEDSATSADLNKLSRNFKAIPARSRDDPIKEEIIHESIDNYSNDGNSISQSASVIDTKPVKKHEDKLIDEIKEEDRFEESIPSEINEEYSDDFDESNNSSKFSQSVKSLVKGKNQIAKPVHEEIKEEQVEDEDEDKSTTKKEDSDIKELKKIQSKSDSIIDETPVDSEEDRSVHEELIHRIPTGKSDEYVQKITDSASSIDSEVIGGSNHSVEWVMEIPIEKPTDKKEEKPEIPIDDVSEEYSDSFEDEDISDKEETPRIGDDEDDVMKNPNKLADIIAEELFKSIDISGLYDKTKKIVPPRDFSEEDFKDKFPFKKPQQLKVTNLLELRPQIEFFNDLVTEILRPLNTRRILRKIITPKQTNPLDELQKLKVAQDEDKIEPGDEEPLIDESIFNSVNSRHLKPFQKDKEKFTSISNHNKALFSAFNSTFSSLLPIGLKSTPPSWLSKDQATTSSTKSTNSFTERDLKKLLKRVVKKLTSLVEFSVKSKQRLNSKPKANDEEEAPEKEEKRRKKVMDENLFALIKHEFEDEEREWVTYDREKAQVTFDLADRIMEEIAGETAKIIQELEMKRY